MPFGCCNCGWWVDMGTRATNGPVKRESTWWLVGRFRGRLLLTSRPFRFLAHLKAFSGSLLKILLVVLSSRKTQKLLKMIFLATRLLGWKKATKGSLSLAMLFAASLFKKSALDLVDGSSLPLLMRSFGYPRAAKRVSSFAASMSKSAWLLQIYRSVKNWGWPRSWWSLFSIHDQKN